MSKLLLLDGSSLLHRAFYALPLLSNADGVFTNALHGFMMMFNKLTAQQKPDYVAVCFDKSRLTFRNRIDPEYKGTRSATPEELKGQFELIKEILDAAQVYWLEMEDYEADDLLGTLSRLAAEKNMQVEIFSGDRDVFQLVDQQVHVFMTKKGISEIEQYDPEAIRERYGLEPIQLIQVKGLMGDSSDNIPGVPGVGEKTALKLISRFGSIDSIYENLEQVDGPKLREKLANNREQALRSRELATICRNVPLEVDWQALAFVPDVDVHRLTSLYERLGLRQLSRTLSQQKPAAPEKESLFPPEDPFGDRPWAGSSGEAVSAPSECCSPCSDVAALRAYLQKLREESGCAIFAQWKDAAIDGGLELLSLFGEAAGPFILDLRPGFGPLEVLRPLLEQASFPKQTAAAKELKELLAFHGIQLAGVVDDAYLAAYLLDPAAGDYALEKLALENSLPFSLPPSPQDGAAYARLLPALLRLLRQRLEDSAMLGLYLDMELPLSFVLADMEIQGINVDREQLEAMSQELQAEEKSYQQQIFELAGMEFNLNSPKQLGTVLFEKMGIPPLKKTKTGYSTDAEVLESLAPLYPVAQLLLDYRMVAKLRSTYTEGMVKLINPRSGKLHTRFTQTVTATGRLSSVEPNLQNIPIRQEQGRRIRQVFTASSPQRMLLAADYSQIELRVLAHISGDEKLIAAYQQGEDIHARTAAEVLGIPLEQVSSAQRRQAKAVNFGIVYGISDYGLSRDLGISRKEAQDYIARYYSRYPQVEEWHQILLEQARKDGYVSTIFGRRRYLPDLNNRNYNLRSFAERMAMNAPIQGSAADIIKIAMVRLEQELRQRDFASRMLLQVHDELIFDMAMEEQEFLPQLVREQMEGAVSLSVPLTVDLKQGNNWYAMEKLPE
ncbi:MAG: DNA polymerase I [Bacillota bacterium]|nr:DNA polymerase I [Bacillota bacterium]